MEEQHAVSTVFQFLLQIHQSVLEVQISKIGEVINVVELVMWDEALVAHYHNILADRIVKDIKKNDSFFRIKFIIFYGDPRQTLPVICKGCRSVIVGAPMMKCLHIWNISIKISVTQNM